MADGQRSEDGLRRNPATADEERIDRALKRLDADVRDRLLMFDGGPELMSWEQAHRRHRDEPYIGCCFCQPQFAIVSAETIQDALDRIWEEQGAPIQWDELGERVADLLLDQAQRESAKPLSESSSDA